MVAKRSLIAGLLLLAAGGGAIAYTQGFVGAPDVQRPSFGVADYGDWGEVSEGETEIVHTFWVRNPNPAGVSLGDAITLSYQATINEVELARGELSGIDIRNGNNTVEATTRLSNDRIAPWWVNFVRNNETLTYDLRSEAEVRAGLSYRTRLPRQEGRALTNATPIESALDEAASGLEGRYACTVGDSANPCLGTETGTPTAPNGIAPDSTVGIEVVDGSAEWGDVTSERTNVRFRFRIRNVGDVPIVADARHLGASAALNDVELLRVTRRNHTLRGLDGDALVEPGETRTVTYVVTMDNGRVDEWFRSHVRRDETSRVRLQLQLVFGVENSDVALRVPTDGGVRYRCELQTGILEDGQRSATTCGDGGSLGIGPVDVGLDGATSTPQDGTATPTATRATADGTSTTDRLGSAPTADVSASPTSGTAPLTVRLDASGSSDPDGDVREYVWQFDDGSPPTRGVTVEHVFRRAGTYEVTVTVVDAAGNRDTDTVTVEVGRAVG